MLKNYRRLIDNKPFSAAVITTVQPGIQTTSQGYPAGEEFFSSLALRVYGTVSVATSSAGTLVADGPFRFLRNVYFETDKHGPIINNVDGLSLARLQRFMLGTAPAVTLPTTATADDQVFSGTLKIPFSIPGNIRPEDSHLYMKTARAKLTHQGGVVADFITGGTNSKLEVTTAYLQQTSFVQAQPDGSPLQAKDMPVYVPFVELKKVNVTATESGKKIELPYGERIYHFIGISQRNNSTYAELDNTVITRQANIRLEKNSQPIINTIQWADVQDETKNAFGIETMPSGWGVICAAGENKKPAQITEMINTVDQAAGTLNLFVDATAVSNGDIWIVMAGYMPLSGKAAWQDLPAEIKG